FAVANLVLSGTWRRRRWPRVWGADVCTSDLLSSTTFTLITFAPVEAAVWKVKDGSAAVRFVTSVAVAGYLSWSVKTALALVKPRSEERRVGRACGGRLAPGEAERAVAIALPA